MITDYSRQATDYEAYRTSVPDAPPALNFLDVPTNVQSLFVPFDKFIRQLLTKQTSDILMREPQSPEDETARYYAKNLVFAINSDTTINAFADYSKQGYYIISVNAGLLAVMSLVFRRLFTQASVFPEVGPAIAEPSTTEKIRPIDYSIQDLSSFLAGLPRPQPHLRSDVADICAVLATLFTVYHELWHVFGGHIDYERKQYGSARLREVGQGSRSVRPANISRAIEYDADKASILEIVNVALSLPPLAPPYGVEINGAICAFAITTLFFVFDHQRTNVDPPGHDDHPHPEIRAFQALTMITAETLFRASLSTGPLVIPNLAAVPPPQLSEMIKEATQEAFAVNRLLGRRSANSPPVDDRSSGLEDVFPEQASIRGQISTLEGELRSLESEFQKAQAWAKEKAKEHSRGARNMSERPIWALNGAAIAKKPHPAGSTKSNMRELVSCPECGATINTAKYRRAVELGTAGCSDKCPKCGKMVFIMFDDWVARKPSEFTIIRQDTPKVDR